ncbi:MAG: hypothetical protein K5653_02205 [Clostridiales bacterium]|nr:hypothetical protein [Clostridiales bacterium]
MANQYIKEKFVIIGTDEINEDGTSRQEILKRALYSGDDELTFNRGPVREDNHQLIETMLKGGKVGELSDDDYRRYNAMIRVAKDARIQIYEEELEDGTSVFTADAVIVVPYVVSRESRKDLQKRKRTAIGAMSIVFLVIAIWQFFRADFLYGALGILIAAGMFYWGFIRKPEKDDVVMKYIETGKKGRTW